jgi:hypothetical protein
MNDYEAAIKRWALGYPQYTVYAYVRHNLKIVEITVYTIVSTQAMRFDYELSTSDLDLFPVAELARLSKLVESDIAFIAHGGSLFTDGGFVDERVARQNQKFWEQL